MAGIHAWTSSKNSSVFPGTMSVSNNMERFAQIDWGVKSPSNSAWTFLFSSKFILRKESKLPANLRTDEDFPTCRAPRKSNGFRPVSAFNFRISPRKSANPQTVTFCFIGYEPETGTITNAFFGFITSSDFQNPFVKTGDADALHSTAIILSPFTNARSTSSPVVRRQEKWLIWTKCK